MSEDAIIACKRCRARAVAAEPLVAHGEFWHASNACPCDRRVPTPTKRCPSCAVEPDVLKFDVSISGETACLRYHHKPGCTIGRATEVHESPAGHHYRCSRCSAEFTLTSETPIHYLDGGGFYSLDCPMCWARAEALWEWLR